MAGWIDELLKEWRDSFAALASRDPAQDAGAAPTHALDLLRAHVARSGVQLILSDPVERRQVPDRRSAHLKAVNNETPETVPERGSVARFGLRQYPVCAGGATERLSLVPQESLRTPAETRRAEQAFRASAYSEVEALRADLARLKEALADVLVENRSLKRTLQEQRGVEAG